MSKYNRQPCGHFQSFAFIHQTGEIEWELWNLRPDAWADEVDLIDDLDDDPWGRAKSTPLETRVSMVCHCEDGWEEKNGVFYLIDHECEGEPSVLYGWKLELVEVY